MDEITKPHLKDIEDLQDELIELEQDTAVLKDEELSEQSRLAVEDLLMKIGSMKRLLKNITND